MTTNNEELENKEQIKIVSANSVSFERKNDLIKTLKKLDKSVDSAIEYLDSIVRDDEQDSATRMKAAQFIVEKKIAISESVSKDSLSRAIATSRLMLAEAAVQQKRIKDVMEEDDDEHSVPQYLPSVILDASMVKSM